MAIDWNDLELLDSKELEHSNKYLVLVIYDISDNKKRRLFVKFLEGFGFRVQKSAFEARIGRKLYDKLIREIPKHVSKEDNIRVYKLRGYGEVRSWGSGGVPDEDFIII